jgi:cobalt/nickel transport system ATP-binding protein
MALEICERSLILNEGEIKEDSQTKTILQNEKIMKETRLELPYGFALHHLGDE